MVPVGAYRFNIMNDRESVSSAAESEEDEVEDHEESRSDGDYEVEYDVDSTEEQEERPPQVEYISSRLGDSLVVLEGSPVGFGGNPMGLAGFLLSGRFPHWPG